MHRGLAALVAVAAYLAIASAPASAQCLILCHEQQPSAPAPAPVPKPTEPPAPLQVGFNDTGGHHDDFPEPVFQDLLVDTGAQLHRWVASWGNYEPVEGDLHPGYLDHLHETYSNSLANGVRPIIQIFGSPRWTLDPMARTPGGGIPCKDSEFGACFAPPNIVKRSDIRQAWKGWVKTVAQKFPQAAAIEIWNEPNLQWSWIQEQDPELYAHMVRTAKTALNEIGSGIPVLTGGLSIVSTTDKRYTSLENMLRAIYFHGGQDSFDAISFHVYPCAHHQDKMSLLQKSLERVRRYKDSKNDLGRPIWITETGASTGGSSYDTCGLGFSSSQQGPTLRDAVRWARTRQAESGDLRALIINNLINPLARKSLYQPHYDGRDEYGIVAWAMNASGGVDIHQKPGYAYVRCAFKELC